MVDSKNQSQLKDPNNLLSLVLRSFRKQCDEKNSFACQISPYYEPKSKPFHSGTDPILSETCMDLRERGGRVGDQFLCMTALLASTCCNLNIQTGEEKNIYSDPDSETKNDEQHQLTADF